VRSCIFFVFFFQAEDGIRDPLVTGVQTCALPIYLLHPGPLGGNTHDRDGGDRRPPSPLHGPRMPRSDDVLPFQEHEIPRPSICRSEERRVGKECRTRWWTTR